MSAPSSRSVTTMLKGGCYCGKIRYETDGEVRSATSCHCSICRRTSAAPFVAWFSVPRTRLRIVTGEPATFRSSTRAARTFCAACGTPLTFQEDGSADIDITTCSLDEPAAVPPADHTYFADKLPWIEPGDCLPRYARSRREG